MTADLEITDDEIRDLRNRNYRAYFVGVHGAWHVINLCRIALTEEPGPERDSARARLAKIIRGQP